MDTVYVFRPPGAVATGHEPQFELAVPLLTLWRWVSVYSPLSDLEERRQEVRTALSSQRKFRNANHPEALGVRFTIDEDRLAEELQEIIAKVRVPDGLDAGEAKCSAYLHLRRNAAHKILTVKKPQPYLVRAVKFFYATMLRREKVRHANELKAANDWAERQEQAQEDALKELAGG